MKFNDNFRVGATPDRGGRTGGKSRISTTRPVFATNQRRESGRIVVTVGKKA
jgi:hypothetical protein